MRIRLRKALWKTLQILTIQGKTCPGSCSRLLKTKWSLLSSVKQHKAHSFTSRLSVFFPHQLSCSLLAILSDHWTCWRTACSAVAAVFDRSRNRCIGKLWTTAIRSVFFCLIYENKHSRLDQQKLFPTISYAFSLAHTHTWHLARFIAHPKLYSSFLSSLNLYNYRNCRENGPDFRSCLMIDLGRETDGNNEICLGVRFALCIIKSSTTRSYWALFLGRLSPFFFILFPTLSSVWKST